MSDSERTALLAALWQDYTAITPQAQRIHALLGARGEAIVNDHIALRTYGTGEVCLERMAARFESLGYLPCDSYVFTDKHLRARYWMHPTPGLPKVFISELDLDALAAPARIIVDELLTQLPTGFGNRSDLCTAGRPWQVSHADYLRLLHVSEYAAWVAAFGFRVNHFTVDVGALTTFAGLAELVTFLQENGVTLSIAGGLIKGTSLDGLEQSSTRADDVEVAFADGVHLIPSCYYEFAERHCLPSGEFFQGFVPASANRLFESTNVRS